MNNGEVFYALEDSDGFLRFDSATKLLVRVPTDNNSKFMFSSEASAEQIKSMICNKFSISTGAIRVAKMRYGETRRDE